MICGWYATAPWLRKLKSFASDGKPICLAACYYQKQTADSLKVRQENTQTVTTQFGWRKRHKAISLTPKVVSLICPSSFVLLFLLLSPCPVHWDIQEANWPPWKGDVTWTSCLWDQHLFYKHQAWESLGRQALRLEVFPLTTELTLGFVWFRLCEEKLHLH